MLGWLKKHYSQVSEKNWYSCQNNDEFMLRPCSKQVKNQIKEEKKDKLEKVIHELGLTEGKDYNGKIVLKNNVPLRKEISQKQTNKLIRKLNVNKTSKFAPNVLNSKQPNIRQNRQTNINENVANNNRQKIRINAFRTSEKQKNQLNNRSIQSHF